MEYIILTIFSSIAALFIPAILEIIKINRLPDNFIFFESKIFFLTILIFFLDYYVLKKIIEYFLSFKTKSYRLISLVYIPVILLFFYRKIYSKISFLDRSINGELKEIKYLIGLIIACIIILKIIILFESVDLNKD